MNMRNTPIVLCLFFTLRAISFVYAEDIDNDQPPISHELETIVVTAQRIPTDKKQTAENVTVYTEEDINRLPAQDLGEVLSYIPAVDVQLGGQFGQSTALSINGSSARQVLLMIDGIPFNTQLSGQANPTQIPIGHIDHIEIIKGASSSAWGSSLGGVINVITKDVGNSVKPKGSFTSSFAEFSTTKNSLDLAGKIKELGYFVAGSYLNTNGAQAITNVQEKKLFGKLSLPLSNEAKLVGSFGYNEADVRYALLPTSTFLRSQPYFTRYGKILLDVDQTNYQWNIAYKYNDQDITTESTFISTGALFSSTVFENVYNGISLNGSVALLENSVLVMGADFDWHRIKSNQLLDTGKSINMQAPYMNYTFKWDQWDFITGVRYDHNQKFGSQTSPSFGGVYHLGDSHESLVRAKISRAFNAPPLLQVHNSGVTFGFTILPNPDLKAERATMYELGFESKLFSTVKLELSAYRADIKDGIATITVSPLTTQSQNIRKFRRQGGQLLLNYNVNKNLTLYGSGAFNDVENRTTGEQVRDAGIARQKFTFGANYKSKQGFGFNLSGYYNRWSSSPSRANDRKPIFDVKLTKEFKDIRNNMDAETFLNVHNLTNSKYWSSPSFPIPKRYFEGGFSVKF